MLKLVVASPRPPGEIALTEYLPIVLVWLKLVLKLPSFVAGAASVTGWPPDGIVIMSFTSGLAATSMPVVPLIVTTVPGKATPGAALTLIGVGVSAQATGKMRVGPALTVTSSATIAISFIGVYILIIASVPLSKKDPAFAIFI